MRFLSVKKWDAFQQYKDRDPKWIKVYRDLLDDYQFDSLPEESQLHLIKIWLLAAKIDNKIPDDVDWVSRQIGAKSKVQLNQLRTAGFLVPYESVQACTETYLEEEEETYKEETEEEGETEKAQVHPSDAPPEFDRLWAMYPERAGSNPKRDALIAFRASLKRGKGLQEIEAGLRRYIRFCEATGKIGTETVMQARTFFGPSDRWSEAWKIPRAGAAISHSNDDAIERALRAG